MAKSLVLHVTTQVQDLSRLALTFAEGRDKEMKTSQWGRRQETDSFFDV